MAEPWVDVNGNKYWTMGMGDDLHREDGPAVEYTDGGKIWFKHGELHREDGPAIEHASGTKEWWLNDKQYTEDEFKLLQFAKGIECV